MKNILIKSFLVGLLLWFVQSQQLSAFSIIAFLFFSCLFYIQPIFHTSALLFSFVSFAALALLVSAPFTIVFPFLFYLIIGVKNLILIRRREWYYLLFLSLNYMALFFFFSAEEKAWFWLMSLGFFVFSVGMLREFLRFQEIGVRKFHKIGVFVVAFIELQCLWAISLLPLGIANSVAAMTALIFMVSELTSRYMRGTLTARFIRVSFCFIIAVLCVFFFIGQWKL